LKEKEAKLCNLVSLSRS